MMHHSNSLDLESTDFENHYDRTPSGETNTLKKPDIIDIVLFSFI